MPITQSTNKLLKVGEKSKTFGFVFYLDMFFSFFSQTRTHFTVFSVILKGAYKHRLLFFASKTAPFMERKMFINLNQHSLTFSFKE